jgi:hypothetical protein
MSSPSPATPVDPPAGSYTFKARTFNSQFANSAAAYNSLSTASDGNVYYALTSDIYNVGAQMYRYDPAKDAITHLADLTEVAGEQNANAIVQGKVHVDFHELNGKLYFSTHLGFYDTVPPGPLGREIEGTPPAGVAAYPGGHFLSYDLNSGAFENFGIPVPGEGIIAIALDTSRGLLYGLTWPSGLLVRYDLASRQIYNFGPTSLGGESGTGPTGPNYRALCRSLAIDLPSGNVFLTTADGSVVCASDNKLTTLPPKVSFKRPTLGIYDLAIPGELGYNWRQTVVHAADRCIYGVHGRTGTGLRMEMVTPTRQLLNRLTSMPTRTSGAFDVPRHGYLSFKLGPDGETVFYLTGAHISDDDTEHEVENLHLITFHIPTGQYLDHGSIVLDTGDVPCDVNSIAITKDGMVYAISAIKQGGKINRYDLIMFNPIVTAQQAKKMEIIAF